MTEKRYRVFLVAEAKEMLRKITVLAVIAIIAQGTMADTHEAKTPEQEQQWQAFSVQMRDAAGAVNAAIRAQDEAAAGAAMENLQQSCEDCHAVFHKEEE